MGATEDSEVSLNFLLDLARDAGILVRSSISQLNKKVNSKFSSADLVTQTDIEIENSLKNCIKAKYPSHSFLCEESAVKDQRLTDEPTWIIDPIDGTTNFVHTTPLVCVSIAFAVGKKIIHGVVYNPVQELMFSASRGRGAFLNGTKILTSQCHSLKDALVCTGFCSSVMHKLEEDKKELQLSKSSNAKLSEIKDCVVYNFTQLIQRCHDVRAIGTCALSCCFVAAGYFDFYCQLNIKEWDFAAGILIVEEAGGFTCQFDGSPLGDLHEREVVVGATKELCQEAVALLRRPTFSMTNLD